MSTCQWREKPGSEPVCMILPEQGQYLCPRHSFLQSVRDQERQERDRSRAVGRKTVTRNAKTRRELLEQGFQPIGNAQCSKCEAPIQWFRTPNGNNAPYNPMDALGSPAVSHFATCEYAQTFRRAS